MLSPQTIGKQTAQDNDDLQPCPVCRSAGACTRCIIRTPSQSPLVKRSEIPRTTVCSLESVFKNLHRSSSQASSQRLSLVSASEQRGRPTDLYKSSPTSRVSGMFYPVGRELTSTQGPQGHKNMFMFSCRFHEYQKLVLQCPQGVNLP